MKVDDRKKKRKRGKITPVHARNYSDYTRRVGLAPRGPKNRVALHDSRRGGEALHSAWAMQRSTSGKRPAPTDYYNIGGLK